MDYHSLSEQINSRYYDFPWIAFVLMKRYTWRLGVEREINELENSLKILVLNKQGPNGEPEKRKATAADKVHRIVHYASLSQGKWNWIKLVSRAFRFHLIYLPPIGAKWAARGFEDSSNWSYRESVSGSFYCKGYLHYLHIFLILFIQNLEMDQCCLFSPSALIIFQEEAVNISLSFARTLGKWKWRIIVWTNEFNLSRIKQKISSNENKNRSFFGYSIWVYLNFGKKVVNNADTYLSANSLKLSLKLHRKSNHRWLANFDLARKRAVPSSSMARMGINRNQKSTWV